MSKKTQTGTIIIVALIMILGVIGSVYVVNQKNDQIQSLITEKNDLGMVIQQKDSVMNDLETTFTDIENDLNQIKEKRNLIALTQAEGNKNRKQAIIEDINMMNNLIEESNKKVADLQRKLRNSGMNVAALEKRLQALTETIDSQNTQIAELKKMIEDKDVNLAELHTKVQNMDLDMKKQADSITYKQSVIVDKTDKLNTAHYALGTYKKLKEEGILSREGGVLGIGSSKAIQDNFDSKYFADLDIRKTKTIPLNVKKAVVISEHPTNSYKLVEENGQIAYLEIENPEEFWRISKYAVIEVK